MSLDLENTQRSEMNAQILLGLVVVVVSDGLASSIIHILNDNGVAASFITHGYGTAPSNFYEVLGVGTLKKQIICSITRIDKWNKIKESLNKRFKMSKMAKGVAYLIPLSALMGVTAYRYLTNSFQDKTQEDITNMPNKSNYETIFAIVNDGYTDLVMSSAREAGARGGTIINARGTGNKEIEKFYGVVITPEKQIVMILVPKNIKDDVLTAISNAASFTSKGQGIVFSLPTSDVIGVAEEKSE